MENTHEHLEHIEHAQHAVHDPFNRNVAMTMAIVAAALACVTMLSHREHNATIQLLTEASILENEANAYHTKAADQWAYYQAKNIRKHNYQALKNLAAILPAATASDLARKHAETDWDAQLEQYKEELPKHRGTAEDHDRRAEQLEHEAREKQHASEEAHHRGDRFDLAQLAVELALVLCSIAVLTKRAAFWYSGIVAGCVGLVLALSVFLLH
jgi:hypothetical protein